MFTFSKDIDILRHEPLLFGDLYFRWQVLCAGKDGQLDGMTLTAESQDFISSGVGAGGVVYLNGNDGDLCGAYEIVSVDSATVLTVSVLRADESSDVVAVGSGSGVSYRISTFLPQANEVLVELCKYFGIDAYGSEGQLNIDDIANTEVLRHASTYAVLACIYATMAGGDEISQGFWKKSLHYQRLFEKARERCRLNIDFNGDGSVEDIRTGGIARLIRD